MLSLDFSFDHVLFITEKIFLTKAVLSRMQKINLIYKAQFYLCVYKSVCLSVCLNSSETAWRTNIKRGTIDHLLGVSAIGDW